MTPNRYGVAAYTNSGLRMMGLFDELALARWFKNHCVVNPKVFIIDVRTGDLYE